MLLSTFGADTVTQLNFGMLRQIGFKSVPGILVVADYMTKGANLQDTLKGFDM